MHWILVHCLDTVFARAILDTYSSACHCLRSVRTNISAYFPFCLFKSVQTSSGASSTSCLMSTSPRHEADHSAASSAWAQNDLNHIFTRTQDFKACTQTSFPSLRYRLYLVGGLCYHRSIYTAESVPESGLKARRKWLLYVLCVCLEDMMRKDNDTVKPRTPNCEMALLLHE